MLSVVFRRLGAFHLAEVDKLGDVIDEPEGRGEDSAREEELDLIERLAVLPLSVRALPNTMISGVHHGNEDVDQENDGDGLVDSPHGHTHQMRELIGDTIDVVLIIIVSVSLGAVLIDLHNCCISWLPRIEDLKKIF